LSGYRKANTNRIGTVLIRDCLIIAPWS
jgi:hypothetical protein